MKRKMQNGKWKILWFAFCISCFSFAIACSIPNLEKPECMAARQTVKEFYSNHFGNDMKPSKEKLEQSAKFLTAELKQKLAAQFDEKIDYFTTTDDYPKAFRVGGCNVSSDDKTIFQVLFFWKDDNRNEQREATVETVKQNNQWLINKVEKK